MKFFQLFYEQDGKTPSSRRFIGIIGFLTLVIAIGFDICCDKTVDANLIDALLWVIGLAMAATTTSTTASKIGRLKNDNNNFNE